MNITRNDKQRRISGEWRRGMGGCLFLLAVCLLPFPAWAQIKTTVTDSLLGPDGSPASGTMTISAAGAFRSADGYNVAQGWQIQVPVSAGSFSVTLIPNQGATPSGQNDSYTVTYNLTSSLGTSYWTETWFVPSIGPVGLASVRTLPAFPASFLSPQSPNMVLAGPASGSSAGPAAFRAMAGADLPLPGAASLGGVESLTCSNGQFLNQISTAGAPGCATPAGGSSAFSSLTGGINTNALQIGSGGSLSVTGAGGQSRRMRCLPWVWLRGSLEAAPARNTWDTMETAIRQPAPFPALREAPTVRPPWSWAVGRPSP